MKKNLLLPRGFKTVGRVILVPALLWGCCLLFGWDFFPQTWSERLLNNIALIGVALGFVFVGFSRERDEDEMITSLRLDSLLVSVYVNYALLVAAAILFYDFDFLTCMFVSLYTLPAVYTVLFRIRLWMLRKEAGHEE